LSPGALGAKSRQASWAMAARGQAGRPCGGGQSLVGGTEPGQAWLGTRPMELKIGEAAGS
jgi:hypothetical protein